MVVLRVVREIGEVYAEVNRRLSWLMLCCGGSASLLAYVLYLFGVKPFLSPLRKIPGPGYGPIFGNVREAMVGQAMDASSRWTKKYGGIVRFYHLLGRERVLVTDPQALRHIFVTHEHKYSRPNRPLIEKGPDWIFNAVGDKHKFYRRILNPFFSRNAVDGYLPMFQRGTLNLIELWHSKIRAAPDSNKKVEISVGEDFQRGTLDLIGQTVVGIDLDSLRDPKSELANAFKTLTSPPGVSFWRALPILRWLPTKQKAERKQCEDRIEKLLMGIIRQKKEQGQDSMAAKGDVIGQMLARRDPETGIHMTDDEVFTNCLAIMFAGHETTSMTLSWLLLTLAQNQDVQERLRAEVTQGLPPPGEPVTWDCLEKMDYLVAVIKEIERLYPVAPALLRKVAADDHVNGHFLPAGTYVIAHVGALMRNPKIWPEPETFKPERFLSDQPQPYGLYEYLPFITGPNKCLGHQFAKMNIRVVTALLLREFHFDVVPGKTIKRKLRLTLTPSPSVTLLVTPVG